MTTKLDVTTDESQIRQRLESWTEALRSKDIDGLMSHYAEDILVFDIAPPLQYEGATAYRKTGRIGSPRSKVRLATRFAT